MQNHALVVEGILLRNTFGCDLIENSFLQKMHAKVFPNLRLSQFWIEDACGPQSNGFANQMIAALRASVAEGLRRAPGVRSDHGNQQCDALIGGGGRIDESMQRKRPG